MKELIFNVDGMHCGGCESRIQNVVGDIAGVDKVVANHNDGTVKVTINGDVDTGAIIEAIEDLGFDVKKD